ncbi:bestrophin family protein [Hymenobacter convexus]|uniref:bestrophin family protein n=1 Tax=Hymenobacter sp. CA1UV-4 TaxID=3063782 RepID=UPI0027137D2A|nr:bestrophin family ion channel [Hymenobacter sp. CA1UV-4]MDO7850581.1 bestrophin family ion channel [Hymenobacter sp. CA1UV-4]
MYIRKNLRWNVVWHLTWRSLLIFIVYNTLVCLLYGPLNVHVLDIPWQPVALLGTAVAFYIGFKSNGSYDRFWEGRQLWGSIVNTSRVWAIRVFDFVHPEGNADPDAQPELAALHRRLAYRQVAWCNALRLHLRRQTAELWDTEVAPFLPAAEAAQAKALSNPPTHLLRRQSVELRELAERGLLTEFRQVALMQTIQDLFNAQGGCERIKNTPFPRQFAFFSFAFVWIFAAILPLGLVEEFDHRVALGQYHVWLMVPFSTLVSWVFNVIEVVGHTSENPFENDIYDVPMTTICRSIEIDIRELLQETELPPKIEAVDDVLY